MPGRWTGDRSTARWLSAGCARCTCTTSCGQNSVCFLRSHHPSTRPECSLPSSFYLPFALSAATGYVSPDHTYRMRSGTGASIYMTDITTSSPLLLATASPRRRQIFERLGLPFIVGVPPVDEEVVQERFRGA